MGMVGASENANNPVKWLRLTRRFLIAGRLARNLEDHLFDVLSNLIVHVRHRVSPKDASGSEPIAATVRPA
jgi:hypothetical protein